ncbi:MAG: hypothetical protein VX766_01835 [Pseudomonadota bacterium]|nr:hypothetical protein [Pseudomonadota bacterium]
MHRTIIYRLACIAISAGLAASLPATGADSKVVNAILTAIVEDEAHAFMRTLEPAMADCAAVFTQTPDAERACAYAEAMFAGLAAVPESSMQSTGGEIRIVTATPTLIEAGMAHPVFAPWGELAPRMADHVELFAFLYTDAEGRAVKSRGVLLEGDGRWIFAPRWYRAFED